MAKEEKLLVVMMVTSVGNKGNKPNKVQDGGGEKLIKTVHTRRQCW